MPEKNSASRLGRLFAIWAKVVLKVEEEHKIKLTDIEIDVVTQKMHLIFQLPKDEDSSRCGRHDFPPEL